MNYTNVLKSNITILSVYSCKIIINWHQTLIIKQMLTKLEENKLAPNITHKYCFHFDSSKSNKYLIKKIANNISFLI
jgi:hypothetical protein